VRVQRAVVHHIPRPVSTAQTRWGRRRVDKQLVRFARAETIEVSGGLAGRVGRLETGKKVSSGWLRSLELSWLRSLAEGLAFGFFSTTSGELLSRVSLAGSGVSVTYSIRRRGLRIELADLIEFAVAHVDDAEERDLFLLKALGVLGVDDDAVGRNHVDVSGVFPEQFVVIGVADLNEAGFEFEGLQPGVAQEAPLGVDDALDDGEFGAAVGCDGVIVFGDHFAVLVGVVAGEDGYTRRPAEVVALPASVLGPVLFVAFWRLV